MERVNGAGGRRGEWWAVPNLGRSRYGAADPSPVEGEMVLRVFQESKAVYAAVVAVVLLLGSGPASAAAPDAKSGTVAGVEIGLRGCRVVTVHVEQTPWKSPRVEVRYEKTVQTPLGLGLARTGELDPADVKQTVTEVARVVELLKTEHGLKPEQIHIAASGSLDGVPNLAELTDAVKTATGRPVTALTAEREVLYAMKGIMPDEYMKGAWYADLGAGKVKIGTYVAEGPTSLPEFRSCSVPGLVPFRERAKKRAADQQVTFAEAARREGDALVAEFDKAANANPALVNRKDVLLSGGAVWALTALTKPEEATAAYVPVSARDVSRFGELLRKSPDKFPEPDLSRIRWAAGRDAASAAAKRVGDTFTTEQLIAGAEILRAMSVAFKFETKSVYFPREGGRAWIATFAAEQLTGEPVKLK